MSRFFGTGRALQAQYGVFLLDTLATAAVFAFGVRKLREAYTGMCMKVRRSSDDAEVDIGFDGSGNLDLQALSAHVGTGDGFIDTWYDQSGSANDVVQDTNSVQPRIAAGGAYHQINNRPVAQWANSNAEAVLQKTAINLVQPTTWAMVAWKESNTPGTEGHFFDSTNTAGARQLIGTAASNAWIMYAFNASITGGVIDLNVAHSAIGVFNGAASSLFVDGRTVASGTVGTAGMDNLLLGHGSGAPGLAVDGSIPELLCFTSIISRADMFRIRESVKAYWGCP